MIPEGFILEMRSFMSEKEVNLLIEALEKEPSTAIRLNPGKRAPLPSSLQGEAVEWHKLSCRLKGRPQFTLIPQLHAGAFYVQDPSSMIISHVVSELCKNTSAPICMLDSCAAPGGKSTAAIDALPAGSLLVANEFDPRRAQILAENISKWGAPCAIVTQGDTAAFSGMKDCFDIILADAPCSGEGMMRKDAAAREQWSGGLVRQCADLQHEILENLWNSLKPGGALIYSTCTFNLQENERQAAAFIERHNAESVPLTIPAEWGIGASRQHGLHALRFMPHLVSGEGLFLTVIRKPGETSRPKETRREKKNKKQTASVPPQLPGWITGADEFEFSRNTQGEWSALHKRYSHIGAELEKRTRILQKDIVLATEKGRDLIPHHCLALSTRLNHSAFPCVEVSLDQALDYLRREPIILPPQSPRGFCLITYEGLALGFVKNLGNRSNNMYPANWRIRHL